MSIDAFSHLAWLPVIVGAVLYYIVGAIWYSPPLLLNQWRRAVGLPMTSERPGPKEFVVPAITSIVMSIAIGALAAATGTTTLSAGIILGLTVGVGFALMMTLLDSYLGAPKPQPMNAFLIIGAYHVIGLTIVGAVIGVWR